MSARCAVTLDFRAGLDHPLALPITDDQMLDKLAQIRCQDWASQHQGDKGWSALTTEHAQESKLFCVPRASPTNVQLDIERWISVT